MHSNSRLSSLVKIHQHLPFVRDVSLTKLIDEHAELRESVCVFTQKVLSVGTNKNLALTTLQDLLWSILVVLWNNKLLVDREAIPSGPPGRGSVDHSELTRLQCEILLKDNQLRNALELIANLKSQIPENRVYTPEVTSREAPLLLVDASIVTDEYPVLKINRDGFSECEQLLYLDADCGSARYSNDNKLVQTVLDQSSRGMQTSSAWPKFESRASVPPLEDPNMSWEHHEEDHHRVLHDYDEQIPLCMIDADMQTSSATIALVSSESVIVHNTVNARIVDLEEQIAKSISDKKILSIESFADEKLEHVQHVDHKANQTAKELCCDSAQQTNNEFSAATTEDVNEIIAKQRTDERAPVITRQMVDSVPVVARQMDGKVALLANLMDNSVQTDKSIELVGKQMDHSVQTDQENETPVQQPIKQTEESISIKPTYHPAEESHDRLPVEKAHAEEVLHKTLKGPVRLVMLAVHRVLHLHCHNITALSDSESQTEITDDFVHAASAAGLFIHRSPVHHPLSHGSVFERLYRDAFERLKRHELAAAEARQLETEAYLAKHAPMEVWEIDEEWIDER